MRRSMLFIPGNSPNLLINGDVFGADSVILDLEDAVSPAEKDSARILVRNLLKHARYKGCEIIIRINPAGSGYMEQDLDEVIPFRPGMVMPTKVSCAGDVKGVSKYIGRLEKKNGIEQNSVGLIPLIETAEGVENAFDIVSCSGRVRAVLLGGEDLSADLRCERTKEGAEIFYARQRVVYAARAAGAEVYDTPFTDVDDTEGLYKDARLARNLGFSGKAAISPRHIGIINAVFSPTQEEIDYAHEVMDAIRDAKARGKGVVSLRGKMIDAPVAARAKRVIQEEKAIFGGAERNE